MTLILKMDFKNKIMLAPLAGVNNIAFRKLCTDFGADIVYSQMIASKAFIKGNIKMADFYDEKNVIAQFFGNDPKELTKCATQIQDKVQAIDINMGCPHSDVVQAKCGSYLMKYPKKIEAIVKELVKNLKIPLTVKIRAGFDKEHINAVKIAKICEKQGAAAIAVHGRPRTVSYKQPVDYNIIKQVKDAVTIPVIGNGDIFEGKDAEIMYEDTGCDSVMVARGAIGRPWIFKEIKDYFKGNRSKEIDVKKVFDKYLKYCKKYNVEFLDVKVHAQWMTKGLMGGREIRNSINSSKDIDGLKEIYSSIQ
ncbi:MAG: tRNA-dihydrouridine synthase family protein [Nanoarchaeota archaeon]